MSPQIGSGRRKFPRLPAYQYGKETLRVWCCWCDTWHHHGYDGSPDSYGHRVPHCTNDDSPYKLAGGYELVPAETIERVK